MLLFFVFAWAPACADVIVIGDSIGVGLSLASGAHRFAHNSVAIRGGDTLGQLANADKKSIVILSLGTNDAVGKIVGLEKSIDKLVQGIEERGSRVFWMGPPCVFKPWNENVMTLDRILEARLKHSTISYISVADPAICDRGLRAPDGVHFNMRGYITLWARVAVRAGLPDRVRGTDGEIQLERTRQKMKKLKRTARPTAAQPKVQARTAEDAK